MRLKNIMLVLLVGLLVLLHPGTVEASSIGGGGASFDYTYECQCKGTYLDYYELGENPYIFQSFTHNLSDNNIVSQDNYFYFCKSCNNDEFYSVKITAKSDENFDFYVACIYISHDEIIDSYDEDGNFTQSSFSSFSGSGESNNKYYSFEFVNNGRYPYEHRYDDGFNYSMNEIDLGEMNDLLHELAKFLCGESSSLPGNVTVVTPLPVYDLEAPLGVTLSSSDNSRNFQIYGDGLYQGSDLVIPYKVWWNQSNIDLSGYETEFYVRQYGKYKKSLFSSWVDVMTPYIFDKSFVTAKYCNNSLKYYEFSPKDKKRIYSYCQDEAGEEPYAVEFYHPDFMLRNKKEDENGQMHYSNWVYVKTYDDGTYSVFEMEQEYDLEEDPDETGNIDVDSPNYDDEIIYKDTDYSPDIGGVKDSAKFITVLKDLANSLGDFPDLFAQIFSFLPSWVLVCIGTLFVVIMLKGIF